MRRRSTRRAHLYDKPGYAQLRLRVAENTRNIRTRMGLTQEDLAERAELAPRVVQAIESGETNATLLTLERLAAGLGVDASRLLRRH